MRYVEVNGVRLSSIGLGCWQFGSREWGYGKDYVEKEAGAIVRRALELGITLIDTAEVYGFGTSERVVGRALADRRPEAFVATQVLPVMPLAPIVVHRGRASARPPTSRPPVTATRPPRTSDTSHEVPPMSSPTASGAPDAAAARPAPTAPPAGPDSTVHEP